MEDGLKLEKSTGYSPSIKTEIANDLAPVESTASEKESPVLTVAPSKDESTTSTKEVSASKILAVLMMMGDFKALKAEMPASRVSSSNGKIYWCAEFPGHILAIENGKLLVDGKPADETLNKILAVE